MRSVFIAPTATPPLLRPGCCLPERPAQRCHRWRHSACITAPKPGFRQQLREEAALSTTSTSHTLAVPGQACQRQTVYVFLTRWSQLHGRRHNDRRASITSLQSSLVQSCSPAQADILEEKKRIACYTKTSRFFRRQASIGSRSCTWLRAWLVWQGSGKGLRKTRLYRDSQRIQPV